MNYGKGHKHHEPANWMHPCHAVFLTVILIKCEEK